MSLTTSTGAVSGKGPVPVEPSLAEWRSRCLLAQSLISHRLDTSTADVQAVLAALRGDLALAGGE